MGHNDAIVAAVEEAGVTTYSTDEMAAMLLGPLRRRVQGGRGHAPIKADLTGGLGDVELDMAELAAKAREDMRRMPQTTSRRRAGRGHHRRAAVAAARIHAGTASGMGRPRRRPGRPGGHRRRRRTRPYGSSRTRFEMEVDDELSAAGVLELAWTTGLIRWEDDPNRVGTTPQSGDLVDEAELVERYHDAVVERFGIREFVDDGAIDPDHASPLLVQVFLDKDFSFVVSSEADARAFVEFDPEHTVVRPVPDSRRLAGYPQGGHRDSGAAQDQAVADGRRPDPDRVRPDGVGHQPGHGQLDRPAGVVEHRRDRRRVPVRRVSAPTEVMRWVHPSLVANTQGTGMGGMTSMQTMYHGNLLGRNKPNDILQEVLPNVVAAHVVQSYIGSYGSMIHPVGACATAAVSVEEGVDKIRLGKAELVVAGGSTT